LLRQIKIMVECENSKKYQQNLNNIRKFKYKGNNKIIQDIYNYFIAHILLAEYPNLITHKFIWTHLFTDFWKDYCLDNTFYQITGCEKKTFSSQEEINELSKKN
jgi:hypothetical protein